MSGQGGPLPDGRGSLSPASRGTQLTSEARRTLREGISAYPGTLTYLDLIRKNKRQSAVLMVFMIVLGVLVGGAVGTVFAVRFGAGGDLPSLLPSIVIGALAALIAAILGATWSWYGGASAILAMSGAKEISKEADPELFNVVDELRIAAGLPMPRLYLIGDSALNAFATGRDPEHAAVAITVGLRQKLTRDELQGVMAHEMSHIRHFDIRFALLMATMVGLIAFACDALFRVTWYGGRGMGRSSSDSKGGGGVIVVVLFVLAAVLAVLAPLVSRIIQAAYSRQREYLADAGAVELTRNPEGLAAALLKLADDEDPLVDTANRGTAHLYIVNPLRKMRRSHQKINSMFYSHPPIPERVARLLALAR
jgi:heat shock protein HtpX